MGRGEKRDLGVAGLVIFWGFACNLDPESFSVVVILPFIPYFILLFSKLVFCFILELN